MGSVMGLFKRCIMVELNALRFHFRHFICGLFLLSCLSVSAEPFPKELRLITGDDFKPWSDQSLPNGGIITEIIQTTFKQMGVKTTVDWLPWKRGYHNVVEGKYDYYGTFPYSFSNKRAADVYYSIPVLISGLTIFVLDKNPVVTDYKDQEALHGLRFCTGLGLSLIHISEPTRPY